jgi:fructokinase
MKCGKTVICWGELLWDVFPEGRHPGGSALNVAAHLHRLGFDAVLASAVGNDKAGHDLLDAVAAFGLNTEFISVLEGLPTGTAGVSTGDDGLPRFSISTGTAWDRIPFSRELAEITAQSSAVIYGSLAQRSSANRHNLDSLLKACCGIKVMDVNLRAPHDDPATVMSLARHADIIKVNEDELLRLTTSGGNDIESLARRLPQITGAQIVCVTAGDKGAGLLRDNTWYWEAARHVTVVDTVGAGDAFLARLLAGIIQNEPTASALPCACRLAEKVVAHAGALLPASLEANC